MTATDPRAARAALDRLLTRHGLDRPADADADDPGTADVRSPERELERALDQVWERHPFALAAALTEQVHGVLPLLDTFEADAPLLDGVRTGRVTAALGLYTPNALFSLTVPAVRADRDGDRTTLHGRYRYAARDAETALVTVRLDGATRLALVPHDAPGVRPHGAGRAADHGWAVLDGAAPAALSRPVDWALDGVLTAALDAHAWAFARRALARPARDVADLRRTLARTGEGVEALSTSQYLAHELSKLEIELSLAAAAARFGAAFKDEAPGGTAALATLLSCVDLLRRTARTTEDMATELGLADAPADPDDTGLQAHFGGRRVVENELARRMGLVPEAVAA
ncbi:acyl-CoA dehydrogenase middle domain-containing protein [Kitasatospora fiedleri]|uniref:hypothetical protein n=1 Tax=Kitasatospora fiedleri TaxID=2991545 RepID=UPI002499E8ED|nr:hypothetical protein [Kitasatospora fiedleri]